MIGATMIKKLIVKNFQSHEKTSLDFVKGVNVIVGRSQSGKTALVRALQWCLFNRPTGYRFHREGADSPTTVTVEVDDKRIRHIKDKRTNKYHIGKKTFDKVGRDLPDLVSQALNVSELNVQSQLDSHFLITSSPGIVAKTINRITKFDKIDTWIKTLTKKINSLSSERDMLGSDIEHIGEELKKFKGLAKIKLKIEKLKEIESNISTIKIEKIDLADAIQSLTATEESSKWAGDVKKLKAKCDKAEKIEQRLKELQDQHEGIATYLEVKSLLKDLILEQTEKVKEYKQALKDKKVCPTCFRPIDDHTIKQILEEI